MIESEHEVKARRKLSGLERVMSFVAPEAAYHRMVARERIHEFAAVRPSTARGKLATAFDQGSSESHRKQRERLDAMWEGREMEESFCIIAGLLQKLGIYICGQLEYQPETGDDKLDETYAEYFHDWCGRADVTGRHRFRTLVQLGVSSAIRDGQHGCWKR
jgi:capsid protein